MGLLVVRPGVLTTVQDMGRWGYQRFGVPVAGAMDMTSHRLANLLVGNPESAATLEVTVVGPELRFETPTAFAITGATFELWLGDMRIEMNRRHVATAGQTLVFGSRVVGARAYVAVEGGVDVPLVFGSRSTHLTSAMGGLAGRALQAGDRIPVGAAGVASHGVSDHPRDGLTPLSEEGFRIRVLPGPESELFDSPDMEAFCATRYRVTPESNRMGYRLDGSRLESHGSAEPISSAVPNGCIQVPPSGAPIILLADHQTVGGYPRIAAVISADLPMVGQLMASNWIEFEMCTRETAVRELMALERRVVASA